MTTEVVKEALREINLRLVSNYEFDEAKRTYYGVAIDTAIKELDNYESLLDCMINERKQELINAQHVLNQHSLMNKIFKEGGNIK